MHRYTVYSSSLSLSLQARSLCLFQPIPSNYIYNPLFSLGCILFLIGATINLHSDAILRNLSRTRSNHYQQDYYVIPYGGLFEYVSAPHFLGEILEWIGFCLICNQSLASVSFALFTIANLIPRALAHHAWYLTHFGSKYPRQRKAILPFIL
jgi:steroid 5-alpha reductase family enzyme